MRGVISCGNLSFQLLFWMCGVIHPCTATSQAVIAFDVPAGPAETQLTEFATQAGLEHVIFPDQFRGLRTNEVKGSYPLETALTMLLRGSGVTSTLSPDGKGIGFQPESTLGATSPTPAASKPTDAEVATVQRTTGSGKASPDTNPSLEIVVTGTLMHGDTPIGAPLIVLDDSAIRASGATDFGDLLRMQPQTFGGGPGPFTRDGAIARTNAGLGAGVNLRALGPEATLILVDGHRPAPSGDEGAFVDVSNIPLGIVKRIEILPDGASALYGSDAVGGVIDFITHDGTDPSESYLRFNTVTLGSEHQLLFYQTKSWDWQSGNLFVSLDGSWQSPLEASDRSFYRSNLGWRWT